MRSPALGLLLGLSAFSAGQAAEPDGLPPAGARRLIVLCQSRFVNLITATRRIPVPEELQGSPPETFFNAARSTIRYETESLSPQGRALAKPIESFIAERGYPEVMRLLEVLGRRPGTYYFVGMGMRPYFEMARLLLRGTPAEGRVRFLPISRNLLSGPAERQPLKRYLASQIDLGGPGRVVLIDSIDWPASSRSLESLSLVIEETMVEHGIPKNAARARISLLAIPESARSEKAAWKVSGERHGLSPEIATIAYNFPRWNGSSPKDPRGKYASFGPQGVPTQTDAWREILSRGETAKKERAPLLNLRKYYLSVYQRLAESGDRFRSSPDTETKLREIARAMVSQP